MFAVPQPFPPTTWAGGNLPDRFRAFWSRSHWSNKSVYDDFITRLICTKYAVRCSRINRSESCQMCPLSLIKAIIGRELIMNKNWTDTELVWILPDNNLGWFELLGNRIFFRCIFLPHFTCLLVSATEFAKCSCFSVGKWGRKFSFFNRI